MVTAVIITTLLLIHIFFFIAVFRRNFAVMDIAWGIGFILIATMSYLLNPLSVPNAVLLSIVSIWGTRLSVFIFLRGRGKPEDSRYHALRREWGPHANIQAYFKIFLFQGILMLIISLPVTAGMAQGQRSFTLINWLGLIIWVFGFSFEVWADSYLKQWKAIPENKGKICTTGPWSFCRFPNYFGEVSLWYGVFLVAFNPHVAWTIIGPITINFLILKVTGVPLLEERYEGRPGYHEYKARVPRFIPFTRP